MLFKGLYSYFWKQKSNKNITEWPCKIKLISSLICRSAFEFPFVFHFLLNDFTRGPSDNSKAKAAYVRLLVHSQVQFSNKAVYIPG